MPKFEVYVHVRDSACVVVEADTKEEAEELAWAMLQDDWNDPACEYIEAYEVTE